MATTQRFEGEFVINEVKTSEERISCVMEKYNGLVNRLDLLLKEEEKYASDQLMPIALQILSALKSQQAFIIEGIIKILIPHFIMDRTTEPDGTITWEYSLNKEAMKASNAGKSDKIKPMISMMFGIPGDVVDRLLEQDFPEEVEEMFYKYGVCFCDLLTCEDGETYEEKVPKSN